MTRINNNTRNKYSEHFYYRTCGLLVYLMPQISLAVQSNIMNNSYDFDPSFIVGEVNQSQLERFKEGNPILAGEYNLDSYVNGQWLGKHRYLFSAEKNTYHARTCFNGKRLLEFGVRAQLIKLKLEQFNKDNLAHQQSISLDQDACYPIEQWIEDAHYELNQESLRLDISIPQIALSKNAQGYIDPMMWDRGINAAYLSYHGSVYKSQNRTGLMQAYNNAYATIQAGLNFATWQLRHHGQWQQQKNAAQFDQSRSHYESVNLYAQRAFPDIRGVLRIGESHSNPDILDSFPYRGIDISSDDRMLANSQLGYAPQIRAYAKSNAKIEVRQQGQLIYQTTVAAGQFEINDLYATGFGGELDVRIIEANGEIQRLQIPYASVPQLLRPGMQRYAFTLGQYNQKDIQYNPWVTQAKYQRGLNNTLTLFGAVQAVTDYYAINLGAAFSTPLGAMTFDLTQSNAHLKTEKHRGESYRFSYSKFFAATASYLTLSTYRYSTEDFYRLEQAMRAQNVERGGFSLYAFEQRRNEFQISLNQSLTQKWGSFYVLGSWIDYWKFKQHSTHYQFGYSNHFHRLNYAFSITKRRLENQLGDQSPSETEYMLSLSLPLSFRKSTAHLNANISQDQLNLGLSGHVNEHFNYGISTTKTRGDYRSSNLNAQYRGDYATFGSSYSESNAYRQYAVSLQGNIVAHAKGVVLGADQAQTMVLVYAPNAVGAKVNQVVGVRINKFGYAVIPYVTPYRSHQIQLNTEHMSKEVELIDSSHHTAPYAGAITKVDFATKTGKAIYIQSLRADGQALPFTAEVYNDQDEMIGMVSQGSLAVIRTQQYTGLAIVRWGELPHQQCQIAYDIRAQIQVQFREKKQKIIMLEEPCL